MGAASLASLQDPDVPSFLVAQVLALAGAAAALHQRLRVRSFARGGRVVLWMMAGCLAGGALLGPLLRVPRSVLAGGGDLFAPGWPMAYGALIGAAGAVALAAGSGRRSAALDAFVPAAGILVAIGRLGCLAAGCCFGHPTEARWGIAYPAGSPVFYHHAAHRWVDADATSSLPVVPAPALEVLLGVALVVFGLAAPRRLRTGTTFWIAAVVYAAGRFAAEALRADPRPMAGALSLPQAISSMVLAMAAWRLLRERADEAG